MNRIQPEKQFIQGYHIHQFKEMKTPCVGSTFHLHDPIISSNQGYCIHINLCSLFKEYLFVQSIALVESKYELVAVLL